MSFGDQVPCCRPRSAAEEPLQPQVCVLRLPCRTRGTSTDLDFPTERWTWDPVPGPDVAGGTGREKSGFFSEQKEADPLAGSQRNLRLDTLQNTSSLSSSSTSYAGTRNSYAENLMQKRG